MAEHEAIKSKIDALTAKEGLLTVNETLTTPDPRRVDIGGQSKFKYSKKKCDYFLNSGS
jgi:hypothetical protein